MFTSLHVRDQVRSSVAIAPVEDMQLKTANHGMVWDVGFSRATILTWWSLPNIEHKEELIVKTDFHSKAIFNGGWWVVWRSPMQKN